MAIMLTIHRLIIKIKMVIDDDGANDGDYDNDDGDDDGGDAVDDTDIDDIDDNDVDDDDGDNDVDDDRVIKRESSDEPEEGRLQPQICLRFNFHKI